MYPSLHAAIRLIPVSRATPKDRLNEQLIYFMAAATTISSEAALHDLPVGTRAEVGAVWVRVRARLEGTSPKIVNAVHHYLGLVKAAPFGTDVLGIYWGAFGFEGKRQDAVAELEEASVQRNIAKVSPGYSAGFDFAAGSFGRIALMMMRSIRDRGDLELSRIGFLVRSDRTPDALVAMVAVLAACLTHHSMPGYLEFFDGDGDSVFRVDAMDVPA
jgi:hypothetical protein